MSDIGTTAKIIQQLLKDDANPPSEDYSPYDYGRTVVRHLDEHTVSGLIGDSIRLLPGSLAESFIDGILDGRRISNLRETLFAALPEARETGSASTVVRALRERCDVSRVDLALNLATELEHAGDRNAQDLYAYALLRLLGDRQPAGSKAAVDMKQTGDDYETIQKVLTKLSKIEFGQYARDTLERCMIAK